MSPLRREGNESRSIENWQHWLDEAIGEAQRRGDFDNLPGEGRPLPPRNPHAGEWDLAFSMLDSAGYAPYWIELDKEIRAEAAALAELRERTARYLAEQLAQRHEAPATVGSTKPPPTRRWWPFRSGWAGEWRRDDIPRGPNLAELEATRRRTRTEYLDRSARLDERIAEFNAAIPSDLWRLQRPRIPANQAAQEFDASCPPVTSDAWSEVPDVHGR